MIDPLALQAEFLELVRLDSLSGHEGAVLAVLAEKLRALGLEPGHDEAHVPIGGEVGNLLARVPATDPALPTVMLNAHADTVEPGEGICPVCEGDCIRSQGDTILGADDKAGIAVILAALREVLATGLAHGELQVVFTIAEEVGLYGAQYLHTGWAEPDYVFVLDGGLEVGELVIGAPSAHKLTWKVHGLAAHAGVHPERGVNAIQLAAQAIAAMRLGRLDEETTANVGHITGGLARNIVPDYCEIWGEARSHDEAKLEAQVAHMTECLAQAVAAAPPARLETEVSNSYRRFRLTEADEPVRVAMQAARNLGLEPRLRVGGGGSDANVFNARGVPAVICATGAQGAHSVDEQASVTAMARAATWLVEMLRVSASG